MPEWENWFEIAKQCKYLPENDLKASLLLQLLSNYCLIFMEYVFIEIMSDRMRFVDRGGQYPTSQHSGDCLWGYSRTSKFYLVILFIIVHYNVSCLFVSLVLRFRRTV